MSPVSSRQHSVKSVGPAATLQMTQYHTSGLFAGQSFQFCPAILCYAPEPGRMFLVTTVLKDLLVTSLHSSFGGDYDTEIRASMIPGTYLLGNRLHGEGKFRNQNYIGASGYPRMQCNPAGVSAHHLKNHDSIVRLSCRV